jgi:hypothetical protein
MVKCLPLYAICLYLTVLFGFSLFLFQIKLGTMDQDEAQTEWVIRPYMNTTKKRKFLGD